MKGAGDDNSRRRKVNTLTQRVNLRIVFFILLSGTAVPVQLFIDCCISFESSYYSLRRWGGGLHWRDTTALAPAAASRRVSYRQNPGVPLPQPTGRGTNTRSLWRPRPPMVANRWQPKPLTLLYPFSLSAPNRYQSVANNNSYRYNTAWPAPCLCGRSVPPTFERKGVGWRGKPQQ